MDIKSAFHKYAAYLAAAFIFITLSIIYCYPQLKGKTVFSADSFNGRAAVQESVRYTQETGDHSWWNGAMFSGMPNYQIGGGEYKSSKWLAPLRKVLHKGHNDAAWVLIIYFFCFFILLRALDVDKWLSIAGAIAIALSSYFLVIIAAGHNGKTSTIALMSVVMAGFFFIFRKRYGLGISLAMLFTAAGFSTHPQMAYYIFMMIGLLWLAQLWIHIKEKRIKDFIIASVCFFGAVGIGLGTNCSNVFANAEYAEQTMRGGHSDLTEAGQGDHMNSKGLDIAYATQWSYGIDETFSFLIPGFKGGASSVDVGRKSVLYKALTDEGVPARSAAEFCSAAPIYWGEQPFTAGNVYMGAIVCFLFLLGLLIVEGPYKWALLAATLFSTALAWGHNCMWLTEFFFKYFPLYDKFRAVSSILIVAEIAMPVLGFMAIDALLKEKVTKEKASRSIMLSAAVTGGLCLFFALAGKFIFNFVSPTDAQFASQLPEWAYSAILDQRAAVLSGDSWRSLLLIAAAAGTLQLMSKGKVRSAWAIAFIGVLILIDLWQVDKRYFNDGNFVVKKSDKAIFAKTPYEELLLQDSDPHFRVFNLTANTFNDARTSYYLKSIGGYSAAKLRRYQDLIDEHLSKMHLPVIGMLNAKYIIVKDDKGNEVPQVNPYALGNAWFVEEVDTVGSPREEIEAIGTMDLKTKAVTDKSFSAYVQELQPGYTSQASVSLTKYTPKRLDYVCDSPADGTVVFSEIYYPYGWHAAIDGKPAGHFRVNYILRALNVPAGHHEISFDFDPESVRKGDRIAVLCCILMYLIVAGCIACGVWTRRKKSVEQ